MKPQKLIILIGILFTSIYANANLETERKDSSKTAHQFCLSNEDCIDVVSMELDSLYHQGLNEPRNTSIGTLINRKEKFFVDYCRHSKNKDKLCETYKNQLMLKYITGLLDR